jgi:DNA-binding protein H-NS/DNA-binding protein StpA
MSLLLELAGNKAKARAAAKELTVAQLENLIAGFNNALEKLKEEVAIQEAQEAEKTEKAAKIAQMIAESGLTMEEISLFSMPRAIATKGRTVEAKYRITVDGQVHEWTGRGRTPKVFQEYFDAGNAKDSCLI